MGGIIGIDEVGRGSWAGPLLVVAARAKSKLPDGLKDSKTLTIGQRQKLFEQIQQSCYLGQGWVKSSEVDRLGLAGAMRLAVKRALSDLGAQPQDSIIMDGSVNYCPEEFAKVSCIIKADSNQPIVSAASIYAKVKRDQYMQQLAKRLPGYGFERHVGYGTKAHLRALQQLGVSPQHRLSYKPVKALT